MHNLLVSLPASQPVSLPAWKLIPKTSSNPVATLLHTPAVSHMQPFNSVCVPLQHVTGNWTDLKYIDAL